MPRYIDANAMIRKICGMKCGCERYECGYDEAGCPKVRDLETAPTVSPDELRGVGTWLRKEKVRHNLDGDGDYRYECSACGHSDEHNENVHVPFCWYCGARMGGVQDALS